MQNQTQPSLVDLVENCTRGRWLTIAKELYGSAEVMKAAENPGKSRANCPVHGGDSGNTFKFYANAEETGGGICYKCGDAVHHFEMLKFISGKSHKEVFWDIVDQYDLKKTGKKVYAKVKKIEPKVRIEKPRQWAINNLRETMGRCLPISHELAQPARLYFFNRGLSLENVSEDILFDPKHPFYDSKLKRVTAYYPAIIGILRNVDNTPITLHRTFITRKGEKALGSNSKMMMPTAINGALGSCNPSIHVADGNNRIVAISEGIEDSNAVNLVTGKASFAAYCSHMLEMFLPPVNTEEIHIYGDFNVSGAGQTSAAKSYLNLKSKGYESKIFLPIDKSTPIHLTEKDEKTDFESLSCVLIKFGFNVVKRSSSNGDLDNKIKEQDWNDLYKLDPKHPWFY